MLFLLMTGDKTNARSQYLSAPDEAGALVEWCTHLYNRSTSEPWGTRRGGGEWANRADIVHKPQAVQDPNIK